MLASHRAAVLEGLRRVLIKEGGRPGGLVGEEGRGRAVPI